MMMRARVASDRTQQAAPAIYSTESGTSGNHPDFLPQLLPHKRASACETDSRARSSTMPSGASDGELDLLSALGLTAGEGASAVADLVGRSSTSTRPVRARPRPLFPSARRRPPACKTLPGPVPRRGLSRRCTAWLHLEAASPHSIHPNAPQSHAGPFWSLGMRCVSVRCVRR